jgi:uncharacterized cupin superfamily protein
MAKIDAAAPKGSSSRCPAPFDEPCKTRAWLRLGDAAGLRQFGVNLMGLPPGAWSSQRHWHSHEDEFVYVVEGEVVLTTDGGEYPMRPGDRAGFTAVVKDGYHFRNRSGSDAVLLVVGSRSDEDEWAYSEVDLAVPAGHCSGKVIWRHKDGTPY